MIIGERTAEEVKINIGSAYAKPNREEMKIKGRDISSGLPVEIAVNSDEIREALQDTVMQIVEAVHSVLEKTPPELAADISDRGIYMTGGGCLIDGLDKLIASKTVFRYKSKSVSFIRIPSNLERACKKLGPSKISFNPTISIKTLSNCFFPSSPFSLIGISFHT